ncbi:hypothetical protein C3E89_00955 [Clostridium sp. Cult1]|nr:hypothetical protein [Clostridium sp. Cult1]
MKMKKIAHILLIMLILVTVTVPVSASGYSITLQFRHRGDDVRKLQQTLNQKGYYNYNIDGIYGVITERAVINFQIDHHIRIDGIAGPETQRALHGNSTYFFNPGKAAGTWIVKNKTYVSRIGGHVFYQ